ncbi:hypothetical protein F4553_000856 [Allocatelliglobosispora scoriae]|uniref:Peptidase inhibitor family I36 n=1 Tax=Allocatelliglobosispora scoriae TaxID=643052 RepID=A0A841BEG2_9ACTN|nr:hypothetical protein [Allocatelliglobosispora scoriae]MBB5867477.1 hypothetical protein [Allocatelliglobosispora scoriae]
MTGFVPSPAAAGPAGTASGVLQLEMARQLARYPGGVQTTATQISYDGGRFVIDYAPPSGEVSLLGTPNCPVDWVCFYDLDNYGYPRGKLRDCGWQDLGTWGWRNRLNSVHNNHDYTAIFTDEDLWEAVDVSRKSANPNMGVVRNRADTIYINCG